MSSRSSPVATPERPVQPLGDAPPFVVDLARVDAADLSTVGGKAANLGELMAAGFPVPPGFAITTAAYDAVVAAKELGPAIAAVANPEEGAAIESAFAQATIPPDVEAAILAAYRQLGSPPVAVRSSATAEDLPDAAFAGQQESFLGIINERGLLDSVRRCWGSLWSERAITYREKHGFTHADVKLAVVVQSLVAAESAGVMFTANPITGARDETVIDASSGLGEAIVSGLVTPDHVILRKGRFGWRIVERQFGLREIEVRPRAGGGVEHVAGRAGAGPVLSDRTLRRLAALGEAIQGHFGRPQDIEWAWADGRLYILQARPITALPQPLAKPRRFGLPQSGPSEYFQVRPYPLDMTTWMPAMSEALTRMLPAGNAFPRFDQLWEEEDGVITRFGDWPGPRLSRDLALMPLRLIALAWQYDPRRWREDPMLTEVLAHVAALDARDLATLPPAALLATVREALTLPVDVVELRRRYFPRTILAMLGLRLLLGVLGREDRFGELLSGIDNKTLEANRQLESLAATIRANPDLASIFASTDAAGLWQALRESPAGEGFLPLLHAFLASYGHRETASPLVISSPTWRDDPAIVLGILKGLASAPPVSSETGPAWERERDAILALPQMQLPPLRAAFLALLRGARQFPALREDTHFLMTLPMPVVRQALLELGRRLAAVGALADPDDVLHLRFEELERAARDWPPSQEIIDELRAAAAERAERRDRLADVPLFDVATLSPALPAGDAIFAGTPGSPGVNEGPVRVVRDPSQFGTLQPGEVLVAPYTNPSWTPLFGRAAAVIVDAGSAMSHAAIVAREYGIPAVMGTRDAVQQLHDGQVVRVDGTNGLVYNVASAERSESAA